MQNLRVELFPEGTCYGDEGICDESLRKHHVHKHSGHETEHPHDVVDDVLQAHNAKDPVCVLYIGEEEGGEVENGQKHRVEETGAAVCIVCTVRKQNLLQKQRWG